METLTHVEEILLDLKRSWDILLQAKWTLFTPASAAATAPTAAIVVTCFRLISFMKVKRISLK